jgi:hypothetical protein
MLSHDFKSWMWLGFLWGNSIRYFSGITCSRQTTLSSYPDEKVRSSSDESFWWAGTWETSKRFNTKLCDNFCN